MPRSVHYDQECQTDVDHEVWDDLVGAYNVYRELQDQDDITDLRLAALRNFDPAPKHLSRSRNKSKLKEGEHLTTSNPLSNLTSSKTSQRGPRRREPTAKSKRNSRNETKSISANNAEGTAKSSYPVSAGGVGASLAGSKQTKTKRLEEDDDSEESDVDSEGHDGAGQALQHKPLDSRLNRASQNPRHKAMRSKNSSEEEKQLERMMMIYNEEKDKIA